MEQVKVGYKQTEVGVIPEDWKVETLDEITNLLTNGFVGTATTHYSEALDSVLYIQGYNVEANSFKFQGVKRVKREFHKRHQKSALKEGDLLTIQTGDVGLTTIVPKELEGSNCHALIISRFKTSLIHPKFYSQYFNSKLGRARLKELETGTTMKHLNVGDMLLWKVPVPTLTEQKAIATALSDVDELITKLEKLIEKKKAIKQGAMQQLLTPPHKGGKRLEGFSGEWVEKNLSDFCALITKGTTPTSLGREFTTSGVNFIKAESISQTGDILRDKVAFIDYDCHDLLSRSKLRSGDVLFTIAGVLGRIGLVQDENLPANTNQAVAIIRLDLQKSVSKSFIFHTLRSKSTMRHIESISVQGAQANFSLNDLNNLPIQIPIDIKEQAEIASVLSILDSEVLKMVSKLDKLFRIKQGMMQELLTGRTRLV